MYVLIITHQRLRVHDNETVPVWCCHNYVVHRAPFCESWVFNRAFYIIMLYYGGLGWIIDLSDRLVHYILTIAVYRR